MKKMEKAHCLLCGKQDLHSIGKKPRDRDTAEIMVCNNCGHIQMFPLLTGDEEKEEYDNDASLRFGKFKMSESSDFENIRIKFFEWTKEHVNIYFERLQAFDNVLEIGAGYGFFMEMLNNNEEHKFNIEGIEISKFRLDNFVGGTVHNINTITDEIPEDLRHKFDCIICMHVLEHISKPILFLDRIKQLLQPNGTVIIEVPNVDCILGDISPEYKDFTYFSEHCSYYSAETLKFAFKRAGYEIKSIDTHEIYSVENHCRWARDGVPFIKYSQVYMPDERLEWINTIYKKEIGRLGKGCSLSIEAKI